MIVNETEGGRPCHKESLISALANIERQQRNRNKRTLDHPIGEDSGRRPLDLDSLDHEIHHIPIHQKRNFGNNKLAHSATKTSNSYQHTIAEIRPPIVSPSASMTKKLNTNQWVADSKDPTIEEVSNIKIQDMDIEVISPHAKKRQAKFGGRKSSFMVDKKKAETQKLVKEMNLL